LQPVAREVNPMARINSLSDLLVAQLRDIYDAEKRLTKALPKLARAATSDELRSALETHLQETEGQVSRLEEAFGQLGAPAKAKPCAGMRGIIEEGDEHAHEDYDDDGLRDAAIVGSAQRAEHYEIAAYGTAIAHARLLGRDDVVDLLEATLGEEKAADKKLTAIAETVVNAAAASAEEEQPRSRGEMNRSRSSQGRRATAASRSRRSGRAPRR
jgi:ferritin-like metal-binding protein YciE